MSEVPPEARMPVSGEQLEYDFYKFFGLISLLVLSGVVAMAAAPISDRLPDGLVLLGGVLAIASATISFACQIEVVRLSSGKQEKRRITPFGIPVLSTLFLIAMLMFFIVILEFS